jgi:hypothetical protein
MTAADEGLPTAVPDASKSSAYVRPVLRVFGSVEVLTRSLGNNCNSDGGGTAGMKKTRI